MNYFLLRHDSRLNELHPALLRLAAGNAAMLEVNCDQTAEYPAAYARNGVLLVNEEVRAVLAQYVPQMRFAARFLNDPQHNRQYLYWLAELSEEQAVSAHSKRAPDRRIRELCLYEAAIKTPVFRVVDGPDAWAVIRLDVAESLLRRDFYGIEAVPLKSVRKDGEESWQEKA